MFIALIGDKTGGRRGVGRGSKGGLSGGIIRVFDGVEGEDWGLELLPCSTAVLNWRTPVTGCVPSGALPCYL